MKWFTFTALSLFCISHTVPALAQTACSPSEFMAQDPESIILSDHTKIAFIRTANKEQYGRAVAKLGDKMNFGSTKAILDYELAQEIATAEAQAIKFDLDSRSYENYLAQKVRDKAKDLYVACLRSDKTGEGLRLWLDRKEGDYYFLRGFWIGGDSKSARGLLDKKENTEDEVMIIKIPLEWAPKVERSVVVKAGKRSGGMISVTVDKQSAAYVFVGDPEPVRMVNMERLGPEMTVSSGGTSCVPNTNEQCLTPTKPGGYFLPRTVRFDGMASPSTSAEVTKDTPLQVRVRIVANASNDCQTEIGIHGKMVAIERYPLP